jgi:signal transduction protein with GAF and PtsI domain
VQEQGMQTERVTFLTSREQKAALDAFAARHGLSVGNVVREATSRYIAQPPDECEAELEALTRELEEAMPAMRASIGAMLDDVAAARAAVAEALKKSSNQA